MLFQYLILFIIVGTPIISAVAVLGFLVACVYDRVQIRRGRLLAGNMQEFSQQLKRHRKYLLISAVICVCSWVLVIVFFSMAIANM